ncbi:MAG: N(4)-(beta-N-acetylglucosaminyl)-L-asparaginase [Gemmatimonadota bacterium]|nr:N(4)-(beta-N-acetylglucosaminyl)-L-asparaginase [Gemmatimonadota bacterium]
MSDENSNVDRRQFVRGSLAAGAGFAVFGKSPEAFVSGSRRPSAGVPLIITSHTNDTGRNAMTQAWELLSSGGSALDAVERGANVIEVDPDDHGVGYGGLPNADGVVQLDASIMDGRTYNAGSVAGLERIKNPSSVARLVMERTDHVMLTGEGALEFARSFGFEEEELLTPEAREIWLRWREELNPDDDWGPPDHLRGTDLAPGIDGAVEFEQGTTNVLSVDADGNVAGITTTSGLSWKVPGRVGDSPIIGAGLYVDNAVGAAGVTGRGEDVIKSCAAYHIVMRMRQGRTPQQACEDTADLIMENYANVGIDFTPGEKFVAINRDGEVGACRMGSTRPATMTVHDDSGLSTYEGTLKYGR